MSNEARFEESSSDAPEGSPLQAPPVVMIPGKQLPKHSKLTRSPTRTENSPISVVTPGEEKGHVEEKIGRWSETEHKIFLDGLEKHGKQWKTISTMIGTRTVVQVRTHAQKYFQKLERRSKSKAPSMPILTHHKASKRKSLPSSLPSRKKANRNTHPSKHIMTRSASISLANASAASPPVIQSSYGSTSSLSSENWSTVSPAGVNELDQHSPSVGKDPLLVEDPLPCPEASEEQTDDPLDWLINGGIGQLPESSLDQEHFPDFSDLSSDKFVVAKDAPVLQGIDIADPKVTVQSLFLEDGDNHLP